MEFNEIKAVDVLSDAPNGPSYGRRWWMKYWDADVAKRSRGETIIVRRRFKKNRLTGATYMFPPRSYRDEKQCHEPGYGWGVWERV